MFSLSKTYLGTIFSSSNFLALIITTTMRVPKSLTILILLTILLSVMQGSMSRNLMSHVTLVDFESKTERKLSSMFKQSCSAILSSLNTRKGKLNQIHAVSHREVPSGPNPLHN